MASLPARLIGSASASSARHRFSAATQLGTWWRLVPDCIELELRALLCGLQGHRFLTMNCRGRSSNCVEFTLTSCSMEVLVIMIPFDLYASGIGFYFNAVFLDFHRMIREEGRSIIPHKKGHAVDTLMI